MVEKKKTFGIENCICAEDCQSEECILQGRETGLGKPSLLLHSCCGPCSTSCIERLAPDYDITVFFYNPNITAEEEYKKRKENQIKFIKRYNENPDIPYKVNFMEGDYDSSRFIKLCCPYADEPEGGKRCGICFDMRLEKTAQIAALMNFDTFTTTLTVSPHKDYKVISQIGKRYADIYKVGFLDMDFKKKDGFKRSTQLAKEYELYRQDFCGCEYSRIEAEKRREEKEEKERREKESE